MISSKLNLLEIQIPLTAKQVLLGTKKESEEHHFDLLGDKILIKMKNTYNIVSGMYFLGLLHNSFLLKQISKKWEKTLP